MRTRRSLLLPALLAGFAGVLVAVVGIVEPAAAQTPPAPVEIAQADNGKTFHVAVGQDVVVRLGTDLDWTVTVTPPGILPLAPGVNTLVRGVQGIFRGAQPGTVTVDAQGRQHCNPGQACAQFIVSLKVTVIVDAPTATGPGGVGTPVVVQSAASGAAATPATVRSPAPGAVATRPAVVAALPNTGGGPGNVHGPAWRIAALGLLLLGGALLGIGAEQLPEQR